MVLEVRFHNLVTVKLGFRQTLLDCGFMQTQLPGYRITRLIVEIGSQKYIPIKGAQF